VSVPAGQELIPRLRATWAAVAGPGRARRLLAVPVVIWLCSGFYTVGSNQRGVVLRFGAVAARTDPGLHLAWPWPIDRVYRAGTTEVKRLEVGFRSLGRLVESESEARRSDMLTGDENILKLMMVVQYRLRDPEAYLFHVEQPEFLVERAVESALSAAVASRQVDDVLTGAKAEIQIAAMEEAQKRLDLYGAGITLLSGNLQIVSPPAPVLEAFDDVTAARKDAESQVENARLYENQTVPGARGEAEEVLAQARGQADLRVAQARGEADRFRNLLVEYRRDPEDTRRRLYLETMEQVMSKTQVMVATDPSRITILEGEAGR